MKVLYVVNECAPFVRTSEAADTVSAFASALQQQPQADIRVILPKYRDVDPVWFSQMERVTAFPVDLGWIRQTCGVDMLSFHGVKYYFLDNEYYFSGESAINEGDAEGERFAFFCRAVLEMLPRIGFFPDILHCSGWQSGMVPALLKIHYALNPSYANIRTVFTIHDISKQGAFDWTWMDDLLGLGEKYYSADYLESDGMLNFLKGGIVFSDALTATSPSYAQQICTPAVGAPLDRVLRARTEALTGILNGIDVQEYDPGTDKKIPTLFWHNRLTGKSLCKRALQLESKLPIDNDAALIAMVGPMTDEKGLDLLEYILQEVERGNAQLLFLGMGDSHYEDMLAWAQWRYQGRVSVNFSSNAEYTRRIFAGSDMLLVPSKMEPSGVTPMTAMRYGCIPVVYETGALKDIVKPYYRCGQASTGFAFTHYTPHELLYVLERAVKLFLTNKEAWKHMVSLAMQEDFSAETCAQKYLEVYRSLL